MAIGSLGAGMTLAWHHPLWPMAALSLFFLWCGAVAWRPVLWLFAVPACLPFLNFSPWTGWLVFEEFDILLLGALAAGYGRMVCSFSRGSGPGSPIALWRLLVLLASSGLLALSIGFADAGGLAFDWYAGYGDALNSLRVFKSLGFALLLAPLLSHQMASSKAQASRALAAGMAIGLSVTTLAILWERVAFPGLLNFSAPYRTVALFWEMHVGGGAIDTYLALSTPFALWAVLAARRPAVWTGAAALALLTGYAGLTTFSRGVYFAVVASFLLLGGLLWAQRRGTAISTLLERSWRHHAQTGWRIKAGLLLALALLCEVAVVLGGGTFMSERLAGTERDFGSRLEHWRRGLALLEGPRDGLLGIGLGRLPANYAAKVPGGEFSGGVRLGEEQRSDDPALGHVANRFVSMRGPNTLWHMGGLYALTQQINGDLRGHKRIELSVRSEAAADVSLAICERHLLYDGDCQVAEVRLGATARGKQPVWQALSLPLIGPELEAGHWYAPRLTMLTLSVLSAGVEVDLDNVSLVNSRGQPLLSNGDFSQGLAHWFPAAQSHFDPWHLDNLFLEVLVERGVLGFTLLLAWVACALWLLLLGPARSQAISPYLAASISAALLVGLASSVTDVPRVAFLLYFLMLFSIHL